MATNPILTPSPVAQPNAPAANVKAANPPTSAMAAPSTTPAPPQVPPVGPGVATPPPQAPSPQPGAPMAGYESGDADVKAKIALMQQQAQAQSTKAKTTVVDNIDRQPVTIKSSDVNPATGTAYQVGTTTPAAKDAANIREVARLNNISLQEAEGRYNRARAAEQGLVEKVAPNVVYDPASGRYKDAKNGMYFQGFNPQGGLMFTPDEALAMDTMFKQGAEGGVLTSDDAESAGQVMGSVIERAQSTPLPHAGQTSGGKVINPKTGLPVTSTAAQYEAEFGADYGNMLKQMDEWRKIAEGAGEGELGLIARQQESLLQQKANFMQDIHAQAKAQYDGQLIANKQAAAKAEAFFARTGMIGSSQELQYVADTVMQGEAALRSIADSERKAVNEAEQSYQQQDFALAKEKLNVAKEQRENYQNMFFKQAELKQQFEQMAMRRQEFGMDMQAKAQDMEVRKMELDGRREEAAMKKVSNLVSAGFDLSADTAPEFMKIAADIGWTQNELKTFVSTSKDAIEVKKEQNEIKRQEVAIEASKKIYDLLDKVPAGQAVNIGTSTYFGQQGAGKMEIDENGIGRMMVVDQDTGDIRIKNMGRVGKAEPGQFNIQYDEVTGQPYAFNARTGQFTSASSDYDISERWTQMIPEGEKGGQCGRFVNQLTGLGVGDSLESKIAKCSPELKENPAALQVGDTFVQSTNKPWGHIGLINKIETLPNGRTQLTLTESNWKEDERVSHTRTMYADDPRLKGFAQTAGRLPSEMISESKPILPGVPRKLTLQEKQRQSLEEERAKLEMKSQIESQKPAEPVAFGDKVQFQKLVRDDPWVKDFPEVSRSMSNLQSAYTKAVQAGADKSTRAAADQALITTFNKMLDPGSVVREGEYARSEEGQSVLSRAAGYLGRLKQGGTGITDEARKEMVDVAKLMHDNAMKQYTDTMDNYTTQAQDAGIDPNVYLRRVDLAEKKPKQAAPEGKIWVRNAEGKVGSISKNKFDPKKYVKL